jgi:hydrogenase maturation protease
MSERILVACIGNIFLGDDGFGFEMAQALAGCALLPTVDVRDFGIRGLDLAYTLLQDWKAVVLVDAITRGGTPGTLYLLEPAKSKMAEAGLDPHSMDPASVLATARSLGGCAAQVYIVGCEPEDLGDELEGRLGLTPAVAAAVPEAVRMIQQLIDKLTTAAVLEGATASGGER